jgi:hypothetical protein
MTKETSYGCDERNSMGNGLVLWDEVALLVSKDFPDVK